MSEKKSEILICDNHRQNYPTPLISTMAFARYELWCPYCGYKLGAFDGGTNVQWTKELQEREDKYMEKHKEYLYAHSITYAIGTKWKGQTIHPRDLPVEEKERLKLIRMNGWKAEIKIEEVPAS